MKNLAGRPTPEVDAAIEQELTRCGIEVVRNQPIDNPEVKSTLRGRLGELRFTRAWRYWIVLGKVPLEVAEKLYTDPVGKMDIRVDGSCVRPAPVAPYIYWFDGDGLHLVPESERPKWEDVFKDALEEAIAHRFRFCADLAAEGKPYVTCYHIDSELGLYIFAQEIKKGVGR